MNRQGKDSINMIKCGERCIPICNHCIYCINAEVTMDNGEKIKCEPIRCKLPDHQVSDAGYCNDFHCFRANDQVLEFADKATLNGVLLPAT